jgi:hypothetical protein
MFRSVRRRTPAIKEGRLGEQQFFGGFTEVQVMRHGAENGEAEVFNYRLAAQAFA